MLGAVTGDIIGSPFERQNTKLVEFSPLFQPGCTITDDSVLTLATCDVLLNAGDYARTYQHYATQYPGAGYGGSFRRWSQSPNPKPYGSWGNGSAMRVSPIGWAFNTVDEVLHEALRSAEVTHDHPEGIKGAQAIALGVFLARTQSSKDEIKAEIENRFKYDLNRTIDQIRPTYRFDVSCQGSVPEAILAFLESSNFEHCIRLAISIGGDSDTIACMAGALAHAFYGEIPVAIEEECRKLVPAPLLVVLNKFCEQYL